jgi:diguanylate cyclase (GGDEF)-like protein
MTLLAILSVLLGFSAICYVLMGLRVASGIREFGSVPLGITFTLIGIWVLGGAVELIAPTYSIFAAGHLGHYLGTSFVPVTLLICFRQYTGAPTSTSMIVAMLIVPVFSIVAAATNSWHELMWWLPNVSASGEYLTRPYVMGPWQRFVSAPYGYTMVGLGVMTLLLHSTAVAPAQRRGLFLLAGATIVPVVAIAAHDFGFTPNTLSVVPIVFAAMLPVFAWLIIAERIIEHAPLAYETVFQNMQDPVIVVDDERRIICLNHGAEEMLDTTEQVALRETLESVFGAELREVSEALETGKPQKILTNTGRFLHLQVTPISTNSAVPRTGRVLMFRDVSDVERAQREVQSSEKLLRTLINHSVNGILKLHWEENETGRKVLRCTFANSAAGLFLGEPSDDLVDCTASQLIAKIASGMNARDANMLQTRFVAAEETGEAVNLEAQVNRSGSNQWLRVIVDSVDNDIAVTLIDITERKTEEIRMESIASSDPLTGVLNRRGFERAASKRLNDSEDNATGALLFIDLNDFKQINDDYGHEVGDQLLKETAQRLSTSLRSCDIIGRPGGDEFVVLVPDVLDRVAEKLADRLTQTLKTVYLVDDKSLQCAASIGLALYPENAKTLTGLMRAADQAMYRAKARCRGENVINYCDLLEKAN